MSDLGGYFKQSDLKKIFEFGIQNARDELLIQLLYRTGRRIGEILMLKVKDIDFEQGQIIWNIEKKKRPMRRRKPIDSYNIFLLKRYIEYHDLKADNYIFESSYNEGKPITRQRAFQIVREICERAGVNYVGDKKPHPHHFRHTFAISVVRNMNNASDLKKLQQYLEHSSLGTTENYLQFSSDDLKDIIESQGFYHIQNKDQKD